uniref:WAP domain-containing protein n=1 Tax=Terrapene triunguis TaxID=2587831 RepID=A0A674IWG6_9SAUR
MKSGAIFFLLGLLALWAQLPPASAQVRPGACPRPQGLGVCVERCQGDYSCPPGRKCCSNGCGHVCRGQVTGWRSGVCPRPSGFGLCVEMCSSDAQCRRGQKCCSNGCGHVCTTDRTLGMFQSQNTPPPKSTLRANGQWEESEFAQAPGSVTSLAEIQRLT